MDYRRGEFRRTAPSGVSAASATSAADSRRRAALEMYPSSEMVEDNFDEHLGLGGASPSDDDDDDNDDDDDDVSPNS